MDEQSISFDRAAGFYDSTRGHTPQVSAQIAAAAGRWLPPGAPLLEIGVGTGRIARPLLQRGYPVTGLDLSTKMMQRLLDALPGAQKPPGLVQGDARRLPFAAGTFQAVIAVHVFHLIAGWQAAVFETRRVLRPGGLLLAGYDWRSPDSPVSRIRRKWKEIDQELSDKPNSPRIRDFSDLQDRLVQMGASFQEEVAAEWTSEITPEGYIYLLENNIYSSTWSIPPDRLAETVAELRAWAAQEFGSLERPITMPRRFLWQIYRWES